MFGSYVSAQELVNAEEEKHATYGCIHVRFQHVSPMCHWPSPKKQIHPWSTYTMVDGRNPAPVI